MRTSIAFLALATLAAAHISLIHPSVYDPEQYDDNHKDANGNSDPLEDKTFDQWWWHGNLNHPPKDRPDSVMELPANGKVKAWIANSRTFTPYGWPERMFPNPEAIVEPFSNSQYVKWNNIHTNNRSDVAGCVLGIAYKSNRFDVKPEDFVIFSVAHDCPARWLQTFEIPNLPACPNNMCQCAWFWVHKSYGGTDQMYMTPFQCRVTNAKSDATAVDVARARAPRKCWNPATCTMGPRNPMYWMNKERNNMHEPHLYAPMYSTLYGFAEGAQKDIFVDTNTVNYTPKPFPPLRKCGDRPSRLVSQQNQTSFGDSEFMSSPNCQHQAWLSGDGKLVLGSADRSKVYWDSGIYGMPNIGGGGWRCAVNQDGTITMRNSNGETKWTSPMTQGVGVGPYRLEITDDGQLVFFDGYGNNLWETFWFDNREQNYVTPFNPDPAIWKTFKPNGGRSNSTTGNGGSGNESGNGGSGNGGSGNGGDQSVLVGKDIYGNDYNQTKAQNYQGCQAICQSHSQCKAWAFDTCGNSCWLKNLASSPIDGGSCRTSGVKGNSGGNGVVGYGSVDVGTDRFSGGDFDSTKASSAEDCQSICYRNAKCNSWSFETCSDNTCYLKTGKSLTVNQRGCFSSGEITAPRAQFRANNRMH